MRKVILPNSLRLFEATGPDSLSGTGKYLDAGEEVVVGATETRTYDDMDYAVAPFTYHGKWYYMLLRESGLNQMFTN
jgi:hypothetical protein